MSILRHSDDSSESSDEDVRPTVTIEDLERLLVGTKWRVNVGDGFVDTDLVIGPRVIPAPPEPPKRIPRQPYFRGNDNTFAPYPPNTPERTQEMRDHWTWDLAKEEWIYSD